MDVFWWRGDITTLAVDVIVNAANSSLLGGGGVDGAIHRAAGPELLVAARLLAPCPPGEARLTGAFRLPSRHVIHTVGPVWQGGDAEEAATLAACYRNSMALAVEQGCRSIAFSAISCGVYGYPVVEACRIALDSILRYGRESPTGHLQQVLLVAFEDEVATAYQQLGVTRWPLS